MNIHSSAVVPLVAILVLTGCSSAPVLQNEADISVDDSIAFGSVEVFVNDKKEKWGMKWDGFNDFYLVVLPESSSEAYTHKLSNDGNFYWSLPPGKYTLLAYRWQDGNEARMGEIRAEFSVGDSGEAAYLGAIELRGDEWMMKPEIIDKFDAAKPLFKQKFPDREKEPAKALITFPTPPGNYSFIAPVCHPDWGISCTDNYRGVTPLQPTVANSGFPVAESSTPTFRWEPSTDENTHYDFILYEAATYSIDGIAPKYTKGNLMAYEEDLASNSWVPPMSLKPDTKYYWSVRLRQGALVSSWSTLSYWYFIVIASGSGYGQWFAFQTPK